MSVPSSLDGLGARRAFEPCLLGARPRGRLLSLGAGSRCHEVALPDGVRGIGDRTSSLLPEYPRRYGNVTHCSMVEVKVVEGMCRQGREVPSL